MLEDIVVKYSGDLKNEHLNNGNISIKNFYLSGIQMSGIQKVIWYSEHHLNTIPVFKWWSEYQTKLNPVFKWHSNTGPINDRTTLDHLNTRLVWYPDPHCT